MSVTPKRSSAGVATGHGGRDGMTRVCFRLQVDPARLTEYRDRHAAVWPEMLRAIAASGRRNYSLFLARRRDADRLLRDRRPRGRRRPHSPSRRRRPGGRPRWLPTSSPSKADPTRPPPRSPRSSTSKTSSPTRIRNPAHDRLRRHLRPPRRAGDRAPLVGVRQLGHPVQGVRAARCPARPRTRRSPTRRR